MKWQVLTKRSFDKEFAALQPDTQRRVAAAVLKLADDPFLSGHKKLRGSGDYRIRIGDFRVLYSLDGASRIVRLLAVGNRRDIYR